MKIRLVLMECKKAFRNKYFYISLAVGMVFALMAFLYDVGKYEVFQENVSQMSGNPMMPARGLYNLWIGGESHSLGYTLFYTLLPLLASIPFGWSYCKEKNNGYLKCVVTRCRKRTYYLAKYIAVFLSGGMVILLPLLMNFLLTACFVPASKPSIIYYMYYAVQHGTMWSDIFYKHPTVYVVLYLFLDFIFGGLFATLSYAFSIFVKNWLAVTILPFLCILGLHYSRVLLAYKVYKEISPINFLHATCIENNVDGGIVIVEGLIFLLVPLFAILREGDRGDIF